MSKSKLTPWFKSSTKPVREGVYETTYGNSKPGFSFWNGEYWGYQWKFRSDCFPRYGEFEFAMQNKKWRGLAVKP